MGFQIERTNLVGVKALFAKIAQDMIANGFTLKSGSGNFNATTDTMVVLQATAAVDGNANTQDWRIKLEATSDLILKAYAGTKNQIADNGTVVKLDGGQESAGVLGSDLSTQYFMEITDLASAANIGAYPFSYQLSISDHGVALFVWVEASDSEAKNYFSWFVIQRPVDHATGAALLTGKSPLFCAYYCATLPSDSIKRFVVREADIHRPTKSVTATSDTEDTNAIINSQNQVSINEDSKYVVTFPNGLNTQRYAYTEELDMIGFTSADVVSQWAEVPLRVYGEAEDRIYKAMRANKPNNTGMRILLLKQGGGV